MIESKFTENFHLIKTSSDAYVSGWLKQYSSHFDNVQTSKSNIMTLAFDGSEDYLAGKK